jgi:hypothetical protein
MTDEPREELEETEEEDDVEAHSFDTHEGGEHGVVWKRSEGSDEDEEKGIYKSG